MILQLEQESHRLGNARSHPANSFFLLQVTPTNVNNQMLLDFTLNGLPLNAFAFNSFQKTVCYFPK